MKTVRNMRENEFDIGIIGCGAAGLYLANMIAMERQDLSIAIFERNETGGRKLALTGNGRCNFTNARQSSDCYYSKDPQRAYRIVSAHPYTECLDFYTRMGIAYYERDGYYYPLSDSAGAVAQVFERVLRHPGLHPFLHTGIHRFAREEASFRVTDDNGQSYLCRYLVIATGGLAMPSTGSHGDAYYWLTNMGLPMAEQTPALVPLCYRDRSLDLLAGVRLHAAVTYADHTEYGQLQFTKGHLSGIPVLTLSHPVVAALAAGERVSLSLDLLHGVSDACIRIVTQDASQGNRSIAEALGGLFGDPVIRYLCQATAHCPDDATTAEAIDAILRLCRHLPVEIAAAGTYEQAQVTAGGILLTSLTESMEAVDIPGLYCIGEVVDVDGICGGYNLQWAFSSAAACATDLLQKRK